MRSTNAGFDNIPQSSHDVCGSLHRLVPNAQLIPRSTRLIPTDTQITISPSLFIETDREPANETSHNKQSTRDNVTWTSEIWVRERPFFLLFTSALNYFIVTNKGFHLIESILILGNLGLNIEKARTNSYNVYLPIVMGWVIES